MSEKDERAEQPADIPRIGVPVTGRLHTETCLAYAARTGRAFCIDECERAREWRARPSGAVPKDWREVFDQFDVEGLTGLGFPPDVVARLSALRKAEHREELRGVVVSVGSGSPEAQCDYLGDVCNSSKCPKHGSTRAVKALPPDNVPCIRCQWPQQTHPITEHREGDLVHVLHHISCPVHEGWTPPEKRTETTEPIKRPFKVGDEVFAKGTVMKVDETDGVPLVEFPACEHMQPQEAWVPFDAVELTLPVREKGTGGT